MKLRLSQSVIAMRPLASVIVMGLASSQACAADVSGKVAWVDARNAALLLECVSEQACAAIPSAKAGETYTFVIPSSLMAQVAALKEGQSVTISYDDQKDRGYVLIAVP
jgi:hypothetical protein